MTQAAPQGAQDRPETSATRPRTLAVFAHPDDETLTAGPLLATMAGRGPVTLVTTNRGERGEVIGAELAHLAQDPEALGRHRAQEITGALRALGVDRHYFFDELPGLRGQRPARFTDSGMQWPPGETAVRAVPADDVREDAFSLADPQVTARLLAALIRAERPHLVLTDEPDGGYGHPDHVASHQVTMAAVALAADQRAGSVADDVGADDATTEDIETDDAVPDDAVPDDDPLTGTEPWRVPVVAWVVRPEGRVRQALTWLADYPARPRISEHTGGPIHLPDATGPMPSIVRPDGQVDLDVPLSGEVITALGEAMRAHRTQIQLAHTDPDLVQDSSGHAAGWFGLSNDVLQPVLARATAMVAPGWGSGADLRALVGGGSDDAGAPATARPLDLADPGSDAAPTSAGGGAAPEPAGEAPSGHGSITTEETSHQPAPAQVVPRWYSGVMLGLAGLLGLLVGSIATVFHRWQPPYGLLLALLVVLTGSVLARALADRRGQVVYTGVLFVVVLAMTYLGNGDVIVANEAIGVIWLLGAPLVSVAGAFAPRRWFRDE